MYYEFKVHASEGKGHGPLITNKWRSEIGRDEEGNTWLTEVRMKFNYEEGTAKFYVLFDIDIIRSFDSGDEFDFPFMRNEVMNAKDYWKTLLEYHQGKIVKYNEISKTVDQFIKEHGLK